MMARGMDRKSAPKTITQQATKRPNSYCGIWFPYPAADRRQI